MIPSVPLRSARRALAVVLLALLTLAGVSPAVAADASVTNPGDHAGGAEDLGVQQQGVWTFNATGFVPNGTLTATATLGASTATLGGIGQVAGAWPLDATGATTPVTRVKIPEAIGGTVVPPGPLPVTFTDSAGTSVTRTLDIEPGQTATVTVVEQAGDGRVVRITGEGWTHPTATEVGSVIAIKIDDGAYLRTAARPLYNPATGTEITNDTVWEVIQADADGSFDEEITLPSGATTGTWGSTPAFPDGEQHTLRLLSGFLFPGDVSRTIESGPIMAGVVEPAFSDVPVSHPFFAEIEWAAAEGVVTGYSDGSFGPRNLVSRQAFAAFLHRFAGAPAAPAGQVFPDVPTSHPFAEAIAWAAAEGIVAGYSDGTFGPSNTVSRQAAAAYLYRFAGEPPVEPGQVFSDVPVTHPFAAAITWAAAEGIVQGYSDGTFGPSNSVSRQAAAAFLYRLAG